MSNDIKSARRSARRDDNQAGGRLAFRADRDLPAVVLGIFTIMLGVGGEAARQLLRYDRSAILNDLELWRLFSGHFVHLGWPHLLLNLVGCLLVWFLFRGEFRLWQWALILVSGALFISAGFLLLDPNLGWYVGLSGLLHGLFAAGLLSWLRHPCPEALVVSVLFVGKILWEQIAGPLPLSGDAAGGPVIVAAHLYGALAGGACAAVMLVAKRSESRV